MNRPPANELLFGQPDGIGYLRPHATIEMTRVCTTEPYVINQVHLRRVGSDGAALSYRYIGKQACEGHAQPNTSLIMAVYERSGSS